jgi:predicted RNase H-like HicB family nuclease
MMPPGDEITIEYDEQAQSYYVVWEPPRAIGLGQTRREALEDLLGAAHFGIETAVNLKLAEFVGQGDDKHGEPD